MIRPDRMTLANIFLLKEDSAAVTGALAEMEVIEVSESKLPSEEALLQAIDTRDASAALEGLRSRLMQVAQAMGVEGDNVPASSIRVDPERIAALIDGEFKALEARANELKVRMAKSREAREKYDILAWVAAALEREGLDAATMAGSSYLAMELGAVARITFYRLSEAAALAGHRIFSLGHFGEKEFIAAVTTPDRRDELFEGLSAARFDRVALDDEFFVDGRLSTQVVEMRMWQAREDVTEAGLEITRLVRERGDAIRKWRAEVEVNIHLLESMENYLRGEYSALITGWIPTAAHGLHRAEASRPHPGQDRYRPRRGGQGRRRPCRPRRPRPAVQSARQALQPLFHPAVRASSSSSTASRPTTASTRRRSWPSLSSLSSARCSAT